MSENWFLLPLTTAGSGAAERTVPKYVEAIDALDGFAGQPYAFSESSPFPFGGERRFIACVRGSDTALSTLAGKSDVYSMYGADVLAADVTAYLNDHFREAQQRSFSEWQDSFEPGGSA